MSKIHITLVGGQPAPVYYGIKAIQPEKVVFIYSNESKKSAEQIAKLIKSEFSIRSEMRLFSPTDVNDIKNKCLKCFSRYSNDEVSINISSGTKAWTFFFVSEFSKMAHASFIYVDQNNNVFDYTTGNTTTFDFNIETLFCLYGNPLVNYVKLETYSQEDFDAIITIEKIRRYDYDIFNTLVGELNKHSDKIISEDLKTLSSLKWDKANKTFYFDINKKGSRSKFQLSSPKIRELLFNSGWFEVKTALMLSEWDKCKQLYLNCIFKDKNKSRKNEIDIIVDTGIKPLFVECKTQIFSPTDIDKFKNAVQVYGGKGSKAFIITETPLTDIAEEKCNDSGITTYCIKNGKKKLVETLNQIINTIEK